MPTSQVKEATEVRQVKKTQLRTVPNSRQRVPAKPVATSPSRHAAQTNPAAAKAAAQAAKLARRDRVVLEHVPLVKAIAVRVHENLPVHVDLDDLVHAGILGLFDAASKFNPDKQVVFSSYAKHRIKGAILDSLPARLGVGAPPRQAGRRSCHPRLGRRASTQSHRA